MDRKKMLENMLDVLRKSDPERLARLEGMGYDTSKIYLHGGAGGINEFNPRKSTGDAVATFFTENPEFANHYSDFKGSATYPVFLKKEGFFNSKNPEHINQIRDAVLKQKGIEGTWLTKSESEGPRLLNDLINKKDDWAQVEGASKAIKKSGFKGADITESTQFMENANEPYVVNKMVFNPQDDVKSIWAKGKGPGLLGGFAAMPNMNPLEDLRKFVDKYREVQGSLADRITEEVSKPFGGADEGLKTLGRIGFDPLNVGAAGEVMGAIELLTPEQKKEKLIKSMEKK